MSNNRSDDTAQTRSVDESDFLAHNSGTGVQVDHAGLNAWMAVLDVEASASESFFQPPQDEAIGDHYFTVARGSRQRPFLGDGTELHTLAHVRNWEGLVETLTAASRNMAFGTEKSSGFTFLHRAYANDAQDSFPPSWAISWILDRFPDLSRTAAGRGELPLHIAAESSGRIRSVDERLAVEQLVKEFPDAVAIRDRFHFETPLVLAIYTGWLVRIMLNEKPMSASVRTSAGDLPIALNLDGKELVQSMLRAYPDAAFERPVRSGKNLLLAHACREGARFDVLRSILDVAGSAQFKIVDQTNPLFQFWRRMCIIGCKYFKPGGDNWRKAELLTKVAYTGSTKVDSGNIHLLHAAAGTYCPLQFIRIIAGLYPSQLREKDGKGRLPLMIAAAACTDIFSFYPKLLNMELASVEDMAEPCDENEWTGVGEQPVKGFSCSIDLLLNFYRDAAKVADISGRLPLCTAIASGKKWDQGVKCLVEAAPEALMARDVKSHLYPFMLAGVGDWSSIDTVFQLLLSNPEVAATGILR